VACGTYHTVHMQDLSARWWESHMTPTAYTLLRRDKLLSVDNISANIVRTSSDADR
jgi:hypothetical protein